MWQQCERIIDLCMVSLGVKHKSLTKTGNEVSTTMPFSKTKHLKFRSLGRTDCELVKL